MKPRYEIYTACARDVDRVMKIIGDMQASPVFIREIGTIGTLAICTRAAGERIVDALEAYQSTVQEGK